MTHWTEKPTTRGRRNADCRGGGKTKKLSRGIGRKTIFLANTPFLPYCTDEYSLCSNGNLHPPTYRHEFGETLPAGEQTWIAEEVDKHIQGCLRVLLAEGGTAADGLVVVEAAAAAADGGVSEEYGES